MNARDMNARDHATTAATLQKAAGSNPTQAVIDFVKDTYAPQVISLTGESIDTTIIAAPQGINLRPVTDFTDKFLDAPRRKTGIVRADTLTSFCDVVAAHKEESSVIFMAGKTGGMTAVLNYHGVGKDAQRFGDLRVEYNPVKSSEWSAWKNNSGKDLTVPDFAEFIDDRIMDIAEPPAADSEDESDIRMLDLAKSHSTTFADKMKLIELSRGLRVHTKDDIETSINTANGEMSIQFKTEHQTAAGEKLKVPGMFCITIPVFDRGAVYRLPCRLKYRAQGGTVKFTYILVNDEKATEHAINEMADTVRAATGLPIYFGTAPTTASVS